MTMTNTAHKQYTLTLSGSAQDVSFRGYIQDLAKRLSIGGVIYNVGDEEVRILCEGDRKTINQFYRDIKRYNLAQIKESKMEKGIRIPYPMVRAVWTLEQEIYNKLDRVRLLYDINSNVAGMRNDTKVGFSDMRDGFKDMKDGFKGVEKVLKVISKKL